MNDPADVVCGSSPKLVFSFKICVAITMLLIGVLWEDYRVNVGSQAPRFSL